MSEVDGKHHEGGDHVVLPDPEKAKIEELEDSGRAVNRRPERWNDLNSRAEKTARRQEGQAACGSRVLQGVLPWSRVIWAGLRPSRCGAAPSRVR